MIQSSYYLMETVPKKEKGFPLHKAFMFLLLKQAYKATINH